MDGITDIIYKLFRFGLVGLSGMVIDFGVTYLAKEKLKIQKYVANALGFICAATSNYTLNRIWTFESHNQNVLLEYGEYIIVVAIGLIINSTILWLLINKKNMKFYIAKVFAILITILWNFTMTKLFVFQA